MSDEDHQEAQHHHHPEERAHGGGVGVLIDCGRDAGRGWSRLLGQQVGYVGEGAVVWKREGGQDVAHERVQVDRAHGGLDVILAKGWPTGHEHRLHATQGVVVAVVPHCRENIRHLFPQSFGVNYSCIVSL